MAESKDDPSGLLSALAAASNSDDDPDDVIAALGSKLNKLNPPPPPPPDPNRDALLSAADLYLWFLNSAVRIAQYANVTITALRDLQARGFAHLTPAQWSPDDPESMSQVLVALSRKSQVDFLKEEGENAGPHIFGQAAVSMWGTLEVFVDDLLLAVVKHQPSRIAKVPQGVKVTLSEFYAYDEDKRIREVVRLVGDSLASSFQPGTGKFETMLNAFGLGGAIERLTKETILEFAAVRNCIVHRKGIVDAKFKKACGTSTLNVGDEIRLTADDIDRYYYAAVHYAATIVDRVMVQCVPDIGFDFRTGEWLETLKKLDAKRAAASTSSTT